MEAFVDITRKGVSAFQQPVKPPLVMQTLEVTVAPAVYDNVAVVVSDSTVTESSVVGCFLHPNADWDADELIGFSVRGEPGQLNGTVVITLCANMGPIVGTYKISYIVG